MTDEELRALLAAATPGPWPMKPTGDYKRILVGIGLVDGPHGYDVAEVYSDDCDRKEADANARLIAAAPDLAAEVLRLRAERDEAQALIYAARQERNAAEDQEKELAEELRRVKTEVDATLKDRAFIMAERDRTFALMLARAEAAEAQVAKLVEALTRIRNYCAHSPTTQAEINCAAWADAALSTVKKHSPRLGDCGFQKQESAMNDAMKADDRSPDYKSAMLYHSDRADAYMAERDALAARVRELEDYSGALVQEMRDRADRPGAKAMSSSDFDCLVLDGLAEAIKAMRKYPQPNYIISKIAEEAGEVVKAAIHCAEGRETPENLRGEMKQLIAMLYRLWAEGDQVHGLQSVSAALSNVRQEGGE